MRNLTTAMTVLLVCLLAVAVPGSTSAAQSQIAPVAVAEVGDLTVDSQTQVATVELDGSRSFDPDANGGIATYKWEVLTQEYQWLSIANSDQAEATFELPREELAEKYGYSIEFKLTVTDRGTPTATASDTVVYKLELGPRVDIAVFAHLPDPDELEGYDDNQNDVVDENAERYPLEGVIDAPGENGNADNEWHIRDGSLLEIVAIGFAGNSGDVLPKSAFSWKLLYASPVQSVTDSLPGDTDGEYSLSTDEDPDTPGEAETVALLPYTQGDAADPYFVFYTLTVTDSFGRTARELVKIVIRDHPADPEVEVGHPESDPSATTEDGKRQGVQAAGKNRYVVSPDAAEAGLTLTATGSADGRGRSSQLSHTWSGAGVVASPANQPGATSRAVFTASADTEQGAAFTVKVVVADPAGRSGEAEIVLVVADNQRPSAQVTAPDSGIDTPDGANGGWPEDDPPSGEVVLRGVGFDPDGDPVVFQWSQVKDSAGEPLDKVFKGPRLSLRGSATSTVSFDLPEVTEGTQYEVYLEFEVTDRWGVPATDVVKVTIHDGDDDLRAMPDPLRKVPTGSFVRLRGAVSSGIVSADTLSRVAYSWTYKGIETVPRTEERIPVTPAEEQQGFVAGEWFPYSDGTYHPTAGGRLKGADGRFPYFDAPELGEFDSVKLAFELTVESGVEGDQDHTKDSATVAVTVVNGFFSGAVDGPDFCANLSLGGPLTYPFDGDGDDVADICSIRGSRRAAVARQNALETLAVLNPDLLIAALHGMLDKADTEDDESTQGTCATAPVDLGDAEDDLAEDVCGRAERETSSLPAPIDPVKSERFFSGVVTGPNYCTNLSLGGPTTYAFDSDGDGVADICSLPFTRREAVARQNALNAAFSQHEQYADALRAACDALGSTSFGDNARDLARDECEAPAPPTLGTPLPTAGN